MLTCKKFFIDIFFFFSYQSVLKALDILKQQLKRATGDVETLETLKMEAMKDPYTFVVDLRQKKSIKAPKLQKVIAVPPIDWNKYRFLPESRLVQQANALQNLTQHYQTKKSTYCVSIKYLPLPSLSDHYYRI